MVLSTMPGPPAMKTPNRRMTLGPVPGTGNKASRPSMTPSAHNGASRPPRKSMIPRVGRENVVPETPGSVTKSTAASRRRSVGVVSQSRRQSLLPPAGPIAAPKTDPRPLNDKTYQQTCIKRLLNYLLESQYEYPVSHKTLLRPSGKDFANIVTFLLRKVDPNFFDGSMKLEDEIAMNFKALGYPFTISKTSLVAAGSPHTWPSLLAALTWLVEYLLIRENDYDKDDNKGFESLEEMEAKTDKFFFFYLHGAYQAFLRSDGKRTEELETALADRFERDDALIEQEIERVTDLNATIVEKITALTEGSQDLSVYEKKREDYATDLEQFQDLIRQMEEHKKALEQKVEERTSELTETNEKLLNMNRHIESLKQTIASQEISVQDVQKMENEIKGINEALERTHNLKDQRRKALFQAEEGLAIVWNELDEAVGKYNEKLSQFSSEPDLAPELIPFKARLDKDGLLKDQEALLGVNLTSQAQPTVSQCIKDYQSQAESRKWEHQDALDRLEKAQELRQDDEYQLKIVQEKHAKNEENLAQEQETHDAKLSVRQREVEAMEDKIASLRDPVALEEQMASYERQCAELEALRIKHEEENIAQKKAVKDEIAQSIILMQDQERHFRQKMTELEEYLIQKQASQAELVVPKNVDL